MALLRVVRLDSEILRYANSRMGGGDLSCKTNAPFSCGTCGEDHIKD